MKRFLTSTFLAAAIFFSGVFLPLMAASIPENLGLELQYKAELEKQQQKWGATNPALAGSLEKLAGYYFSVSKYSDALPLYQRMSSLCIGAQGFEAKSAVALQQMVRIDFSTDHLDDAVISGHQWLMAVQTLGGVDSLQAADVLGQMADMEVSRMPDEAELNLKRALAIRKKSMGSDDPKLLATEEALTRLYVAKKSFTAAEPFAKAVFDARLRVAGPLKRDIDGPLNTLADIYVAESRTADAVSICLQVLDSRTKSLDKKDPLVVELNRKLVKLGGNGPSSLGAGQPAAKP